MNNTDQEFQFIVYATDEYLCGELRSNKLLDYAYHIKEENSYYEKREDGYSRNNEIYGIVVDKKQEQQLNKELIAKNCAKVLYDEQYIPAESIRAANVS